MDWVPDRLIQDLGDFSRGPHGLEECPPPDYGGFDGLKFRLMVPPYLREPRGWKDEHAWVMDYLEAYSIEGAQFIPRTLLGQHRYWNTVLRLLAFDVLVNVVLVWFFTRPRSQKPSLETIA